MSKAPAIAADPMKAWRDWFVQNEREWSESLTRMLKDETVAKGMGQEIHAATHRQQMLTQGMAGPMAAMNLPTRDDLVALGERMGLVEDALARIEAMLVQSRSPTTTKPPRTRKPPATTRKKAGR